MYIIDKNIKLVIGRYGNRYSYQEVYEKVLGVLEDDYYNPGAIFKLHVEYPTDHRGTVWGSGIAYLRFDIKQVSGHPVVITCYTGIPDMDDYEEVEEKDLEECSGCEVEPDGLLGLRWSYNGEHLETFDRMPEPRLKTFRDLDNWMGSELKYGYTLFRINNRQLIRISEDAEDHSLTAHISVNVGETGPMSGYNDVMTINIPKFSRHDHAIVTRCADDKQLWICDGLYYYLDETLDVLPQEVYEILIKALGAYSTAYEAFAG